MNSGDSQNEKRAQGRALVPLILKAVALAMGVVVVVLSAMKEIDRTSAVTMLGIGLVCMSLSALKNKDK